MNFKDWVTQKRGRSVAVALALGIRPPTVSDWVRGNNVIPVDRCVAIERATDGAVTRKDLRPSDWQDHWPELAQGSSSAGATGQGA